MADKSHFVCLSLRALYLLNAHIIKADYEIVNQRTNGTVNAHLICWTSKAQDIQKMENIW